MDLIKLNRELNRLLAEASQVAKKRNILLNAVARGDLRIGESVQSELVAQSEHTRRLITGLTDGVVQVKHVVGNLDSEWGQPPEGLRAAYSNLYERAYGTRALRIADDVGKAQAKRVSFPTRSDTKQQRGGAKPGKSASASKRNVIIDHQAWEFKRTIDRRLRMIQADIRDFLSGGSPRSLEAKICLTCSRYAKNEWTFCPFDGTELKESE